MKNTKFKKYLLILLLFISTFYIFPLYAYKDLTPKYSFSIITKIVASILTGNHYETQFKLTPYIISSELFNDYLKRLDPNHLYFTQNDVDTLKENIKGSLYDQLLDGNTDFAFSAYNMLVKKVIKREKFVKNLLNQKFDFNKDETFNFDRTDANWAKNEKELDEIWRKKVKNDLLTYNLMKEIAKENQKEKNLSPASKETIKNTKRKNKEKTPKEKILYNLNSYVKYLTKNTPMSVLELYLNTFTHLYDPHSAYMSPHTEENFNIQMKLSFVGIGAYLKDDDGYIKVERIIPGGPADKAGNLKAGDRIIAVGEDNKEPVNVIDIPITDVVKKIRGKKDTNVHLTILPADEGLQGIPEEIIIKRGIVKLKDSEATEKILDVISPNNKKLKIGILDLPSFYYDFGAASSKKKEIKSSTQDVKKILEQLNKEHIDGLIIDLRANGGGSLKEAIDLTGLFIESGPIVQTKNQQGQIDIQKDSDQTCIYKGPLIVLVSKLSASAAEIFAGAMQDYNRAIIIGDKSTHGKGTVQSVFDLNNLIGPFNFLDLKLGAIKLTNAMFYRVDGSSTQKRGVVPDITFNSLTDSLGIGEGELEHSLPWDYINPVPHHKYKNLEKYINELDVNSIKRRKQNEKFKKLDNLITLYNKLKNKKTVSLNEKTRLENYKKEKKILESQKKALSSTISRETKTDTETDNDIFLNESINIMADYIDLLNNNKTQKIVKKTS